MTSLPAWISSALDAGLDHVSRLELRDRAQAISDSYRAGGNSHLIRSDLDALAYAVVRMPATFSAVRAALAHAAEIIPDFEPGSLLDVGAGPGTASWASLDAWPSLTQATLVDCNQRLLDFARHLGGRAGLAPAVLPGNAPEALRDAPSADLVMASYSLTEIPPAALRNVLAELWRLTGRLLVIVEPGTPAGFRRILDCRDALLAEGARILAPCSHEGGCPLSGTPRWCHFSERLPRSRDHQLTKGASVPYEDEKYIYLVAGRGFGTSAGRRVLATPKVSKSDVSLTLCAPDTVEERIIGRGKKDDYKAAKRLDWGDITDL